MKENSPRFWNTNGSPDYRQLINDNDNNNNKELSHSAFSYVSRWQIKSEVRQKTEQIPGHCKRVEKAVHLGFVLLSPSWY